MPKYVLQVVWKNAGQLVGRKRTKDSWGADSTAIGRQLAELNTLQVPHLHVEPYHLMAPHEGKALSS